MSEAIFRLELPSGTVRLARGDTEEGPRSLLPPDVTISRLLAGGPRAVAEAASGANGAGARVPDGAVVLAPADQQEVWAAGVTYGVSRDARIEESSEGDVYARVWDAVRPELFFKAQAWRVVGTEMEIGVRRDSQWNVPEPELVLALSPEMEVAGYTIGNDVSSRSIEGENPLYLPQAKAYDSACALGPALVPLAAVTPPFIIALRVFRADEVVAVLETTTAEMKRSFSELCGYLGRALSFPSGAFLLTGTSIVPQPPFTLTRGDTVEVEISGLGVLRNTVIDVGEP